MRKLTIFLFLALFCPSIMLCAGDGSCKKCEVLREYHKNHPSQYEFYDDYLKDLEEKGADAVNPTPEDMPPEVQFIMKANKEASEKRD